MGDALAFTLIIIIILMHSSAAFYCGDGTSCQCTITYYGLAATCNISAEGKWPGFLREQRQKIDLRINLIDTLTPSWRNQLIRKRRQISGFRSVSLIGDGACALKISFLKCEQPPFTTSSKVSTTNIFVSIL
jgi:hypothetical protein